MFHLTSSCSSKALFNLFGVEFWILHFVRAPCSIDQDWSSWVTNPTRPVWIRHCVASTYCSTPVEKRFGHSNCQRPFFLIVLKGRILGASLTLFPLVQCLVQKILDKSLCEGRMSIQVGLQLLETCPLRSGRGQSTLFLLRCRLVQIGGEYLGEVPPFVISGPCLHQPLCEAPRGLIRRGFSSVP